MSLFDSVKDNIKDQYKGLQQKAADLKEEKARAVALEEARHQKILSGELEPITVTMNLQPDEKAYLELTARRMASVDSIVEETSGTSKKKHIFRRAAVGTVLMPGIGTLAGAATAGSKQKSTTTQKTVSSIQLVDSGQMILTNMRFIFLGNSNVISLPYEEIIAASFSGNQASIKYAGMLSREHYEIFGPEVKDAQLYYNGVMQHRLKEQN